MSNWEPERHRVFRAADRLGYFSIVLFFIGIGGLIAIGQQLWAGDAGDKFLVLITAIPLGLAFPLYKYAQHKERSAEQRLQRILEKGYAKD